jgi:hypothetical protein
LQAVVDDDENQIIGELFAANNESKHRPVGILTDLHKTFAFFWIGGDQDRSTQILYGTKFNDIHRAATFARALLATDQITSFPEEIQNHFPVFAKRADAIEMEVDKNNEGEHDDIGNLDDFEDEMDPMEYQKWKTTKKLRKALSLVPSRFHEWYPITGPIASMYS